MALAASVSGLFLRIFRRQVDKYLLTGLQISLAGGVLQLIAGPADYMWHEQFGFDPFLFTPSHTLLITGIALNGIGMAVGITRLLQARREGIVSVSLPNLSRWLQGIAVLGLATLWLDLNVLVYLVTDLSGIAYTFQLERELTEYVRPFAFSGAVAALSITGTLVFVTAKRLLGWRGAVTLIAMVSAAVSAAANLGFRALALQGRDYGPAIGSFIPLYLSFIIPVFLFDILVRGNGGRRRLLVGSTLVGPFASFLDGWEAFELWSDLTLIPVLLLPVLVGGLIAGLTSVRFTEGFLISKNNLG